MATKAKKVSKVDAVKEPKQRKSSLREKIAFLERQCAQLGTERNQFAVENEELKTKCSNIALACGRLQTEFDRLNNAYNQLITKTEARKSIRAWVLRRLGLR